MLELVEVVDGGATPLDVPLGQIPQEHQRDCGVDSHVDALTGPVSLLLVVRLRRHHLLVQVRLERVVPVSHRVLLQVGVFVA